MDFKIFHICYYLFHQCAVFSVQCTAYSVQCTLYSGHAQCTLCNVQCTRYPGCAIQVLRFYKVPYYHIVGERIWYLDDVVFPPVVKSALCTLFVRSCPREDGEDDQQNTRREQIEVNGIREFNWRPHSLFPPIHQASYSPGYDDHWGQRGESDSTWTSRK